MSPIMPGGAVLTWPPVISGDAMEYGSRRAPACWHSLMAWLANMLLEVPSSGNSQQCWELATLSCLLIEQVQNE